MKIIKKREKVYKNNKIIKKTKLQKILEIKSSNLSLSYKIKLLQFLKIGNLFLLQKHLLTIGFNSIMKQIELNQQIIVCFCKDCPLLLLDSLINACSVRKIQIAFLPGVSGKELGKVLLIKRIGCFSFPIQSSSSSSSSSSTTTTINNNTNSSKLSELNDFERGLFDGIGETLEGLCNIVNQAISIPDNP